MILRVARIDELIQRHKHDDPVRLAQEEAPAESEARRIRLAGSGMQAFRKALLVGGATDVRDSILEELREYFTGAYFSVASSDEGKSREQIALWSINLLWYAYLQAEGFANPVNVEVIDAAGVAPVERRHLDFGSGVGVTSQLFHSRGYAVELADIEDGLLAFARYRLERRGINARYIQLGGQPLPRDLYDVITTIDTLSFVPDFQSCVHALRSAVKTNGQLFANFDTRHGVHIGWDILHYDSLRLRRQLQEAGFEPGVKLGSGVRQYRAVEATGVRHLIRRARDAVLFPTRRSYWAARARLSRNGS